MPMIWHRLIWMRLRGRLKKDMQRLFRSSRHPKGIMTERQCCLPEEIFLRQRWRQLRDALNSAKRKTASFYMENGKPAAEPSFRLQVKNAEFELEQKKERLEETEVTSPIDGTVVRVNSRVGRFADMVDDDKPLFAIDNLDNLEMKISVSEYSIGKVKLGQEAEITADILNGETEQGVITAISPTGEEKGGGSTERVIPTTTGSRIRIRR